MKKSAVGYSITKSQDGSYGHGHLTINLLLVRDPFYSSDHFDRECSLEYQSNHDSPLDWYGASFHNVGARSLEDLKKATDVATKIFAGVYLGNMQEVLQALRNFKRFVYDKRINEYVEVESLVPATFFAYFDNYKSTGRCTVRVMARDDDEAKRLIAKDMAANNYHTELVAWIEAGQPVRQSYDNAPEVLVLEDYFEIEEEVIE